LSESEKVGTTITCSLKIFVLEDALLSFAGTVSVSARSRVKPKPATRGIK
jgi:hypothetical protein